MMLYFFRYCHRGAGNGAVSSDPVDPTQELYARRRRERCYVGPPPDGAGAERPNQGSGCCHSQLGQIRV